VYDHTTLTENSYHNWMIESIGNCLVMTTFMDNFDMEEYLINTVGVKEEHIKWDVWTKEAYIFLLKFIKGKTEHFMIEDVRNFAEMNGLESPKSKRAWGIIAVTAKKQNLIENIGYCKVKNNKAHNTPAAVWKSLI
jgi:hypothetical protein